MKKIHVAAVFAVLLVASFLFISVFLSTTRENNSPDVFVGIDVAYGDVEQIKLLLDEVSSYTNTFVVGSTEITYNVEKLNKVCDYVYSKDMYFMIYMHPDVDGLDDQRQWVENASTLWGQFFLGLYAYDEPGGRQLDNAQYKVLDELPANYTDAAEKYATRLGEFLGVIRENPIYAGNMSLFTSDYALYWFDYKGGYDGVFAEFGWNYSRNLNIALCRGAATTQNKEWGVMMTWTYNHPPYLESGEELYQDMVLAYENGAKYILVFDSNSDYTDGVLTEEHLDALKQFWSYTKNNPRQATASSERVVYILPKGYAYGFRGPQDKIWGFWEGADNPLCSMISVDVGNLLDEYGTKLDIIYDDELVLDSTYSKYIYWNGTIISGS
jgi:hypothetical protein